MILVSVFFLYPLGNAIYYSFVNFDGVNAQPAFVGLDNYRRMFADAEVWHALGNNAIWIVLGTISPLLIGLTLALLLWKVGRAGIYYRLIFFFPYVLPAIAMAIVWSWIYDPISGWLNRVLEAIGLTRFTTGWLGDPNTALYAVLITAIWAYTGFVLIILLSALRNVDIELVDASRLDGVNAVQGLWYVILPQIMPVFLMVTTVTLVGGFSVFDIVFIMTGGGPNNTTNVIGTYAYDSAFQLSQISYGTTLALLITALSVPAAVAINRLQRKLSLQGRGA